MASKLTDTAYYARKGINYGILGVFAFIVAWILWGIFLQALRVMFPPKLPPPNHAFDKLPIIIFPPSLPPPLQYTFKLETIEGGVPKASESAVVYFMPKNPANLLALSKTQRFAQQLGFVPEPVQESRSIYRFDDITYPLRRLRYDIVSYNFTLRYGYEEDTVLFTDRLLPEANQAIDDARKFLEQYSLFPTDFAGGVKQTTYLKLTGNTLDTVGNRSEADAIRVDFFRQNVRGLPVYTPFPHEAPIFMVFSGAKDQKKKILTASYTYWPVDYQTTATYRLKPTEQAWEELQNGKGYIAQYPQKGSQITVRGVKTGYYDSYDPQPYLQPIYIFEGDEGFLGYVSAIDTSWVTEPSPFPTP